MSDQDREDEDTSAILSRRELLIAGAVAGVAVAASASAQPCLSQVAPPPTVMFSRDPGRRNTPLDRLPPAIQGPLMHLTIYAAGGGLTSRPWRIRLSLYGNLSAAEGDRAGGSSAGTLPRNWETQVSERELREIVALADRAWREPRQPSAHPTADYDEVLAMRDGDEVFFVQGFGPLRGGAVEALIARLRAVANAAAR
ncbi:MAG: hypothetical protein IT378_08085 [Sandaracinaceae bacterium]|nr:hypothetical protein [Sandaracinaceae bacterium]